MWVSKAQNFKLKQCFVSLVYSLNIQYMDYRGFHVNIILFIVFTYIDTYSLIH